MGLMRQNDRVTTLTQQTHKQMENWFISLDEHAEGCCVGWIKYGFQFQLRILDFRAVWQVVCTLLNESIGLWQNSQKQIRGEYLGSIKCVCNRQLCLRLAILGASVSNGSCQTSLKSNTCWETIKQLWKILRGEIPCGTFHVVHKYRNRRIYPYISVSIHPRPFAHCKMHRPSLVNILKVEKPNLTRKE
jgi:hypothetical protein